MFVILVGCKVGMVWVVQFWGDWCWLMCVFIKDVMEFVFV